MRRGRNRSREETVRKEGTQEIEEKRTKLGGGGKRINMGGGGKS